MPIVLLSVLTACGVSIGSTEAPILVGPPIGLIQSCEKPVVLPDHGSRYMEKIYSDEWMKEQGFFDTQKKPHTIVEYIE